MIFLGIETSCDETAVALVQNSSLLGHVLYQQDHRASGGVIPQVAAREHLTQLPGIIEKLFATTEISPKDISGIGVTAGPGLVGGLLVGMMFAKGLALSINKPIWPINHLEAHALVARMTLPVSFPYLLLLLSGGHSILATVRGVCNYEVLGQTLDDAVGECLDKVSRALGGPYPGGPYIEQMALQGNPYEIHLPIPLFRDHSLDFSFSGLKSASFRWLAKQENISDRIKSNFCASLQRVIADSLCQRLSFAFEKTSLRHCVIAGGVASNAYFRQRLEETSLNHNAFLISPPPYCCTDNGVMIAWAANEHYRAGIQPNNIFFAQPQWPLHKLKAMH